MARLSRRDARICAVKVLYCADFQKEEDINEFFELVCSESEMEYNDFAKGLFLGACEHRAEIDAAIAENAKGWRIDRIAKMSLAVMRVAVYELLCTDTPSSIVINEALEIDKIFDSDDSPAFINGVLNAVAKSKAQE